MYLWDREQDDIIDKLIHLELEKLDYRVEILNDIRGFNISWE